LLAFRAAFWFRLCAAKGAVAQLTKALANEWGDKGINVNASLPVIWPRQYTALRADPCVLPPFLPDVPWDAGLAFGLAGTGSLSRFGCKQLCERPHPASSMADGSAA